MNHTERYRLMADRLFRLRDDSAFEEFFAPTYTGEYGGKPIAGRDAMKEIVLGFRNAFGDARYDVIDAVEAGDKLWVQWKVTAIHRGTLFGIAPTHAPITITGLTVNRFVDDKVVWGIVQWDRLGLVETLKAASSQLALGV